MHVIYTDSKKVPLRDLWLPSDKFVFAAFVNCLTIIFQAAWDNIITLNNLQALHEEVMSKQADFDSLTEHAQILLQSTTDNRVTSQLTQMSSRYTSLIAMSKVGFLKFFIEAYA